MNIVLKERSFGLIESFEKTPARTAFHRQFENAYRRQGSNEVVLDLGLLAPADIDALHDMAQAASDRSVTQQIGTYRRMLADPGSAKITRLPALEGAIVQWLLTDRIDGWLYQRREDGNHVAWVVTSVRYEIPSRMHGNQDPCVKITLSANGAQFKDDSSKTVAAVQTETIVIWQTSLPSTIPEMLSSRGFVHETPELRAEYDRFLDLYLDIIAHPNEQYVCAPGRLLDARKEGYQTKTTLYQQPHRCVNDETLVRRTNLPRANRNFWDEYVARPSDEATQLTRASLPITDQAFTETPLQPYHLVFDLTDHKHLWAHSSVMSLYEYDTALRDKIVLPDDHRDIIEVLLSDLDVLQEDVIDGKGGGTVILCEGDPGLGKTLLAEVYAEVERRILYKVTATQIGITADQVALNMRTIYENAQRWDAIVLMDEADVYVRVRGDDLEQTAIVAHLLQTLEYFAGVLIMTTNRRDAVDDAILSRCLAIIHFDKPTVEMAAAIWRIQAAQLGIEIGDDVIAEMVTHYAYDDANTSQRRVRTAGRDIKSLLRLGGRYAAKRQVPLDAQRLISLAVFKGLA